MAWITITETMVRSAMAGPELNALKQAAGASDGTDEDMLPAIILTAVDEARGHIEDCPENQLGAAGEIPERVKHHVIAIIRFRVMTRLNLQVSNSREREYNDARRFLERVSECKVKIELPDSADVVDEAGGTGSLTTVKSTTRKMTRTTLEGLF